MRPASQIAGRGLYLDYKQPRLLYQSLRNGRFKDVSAEVGPGIQTSAVSRGCAFGDLDNDGDIDIVINNLDAAPSLLRNDGGNRRSWIIVQCEGTRSNRSAIGTRLVLRNGTGQQVREVKAGSSYASHCDTRVHFGLGSLSEVPEMEVRWPSGQAQKLSKVKARQILRLKEPAR